MIQYLYNRDDFNWKASHEMCDNVKVRSSGRFLPVFSGILVHLSPLGSIWFHLYKNIEYNVEIITGRKRKAKSSD